MKKYIVFFVSVLCLTFSTSAQKSASPAFEVTVTGNGSPLFFIPGAGCSGEVWNSSVAHYAQNYTCHVFTLAGYAGVPPLENDTFLPQIKAEIVAYIQAHSLGKATLIGHSIGGFLALWMGSEYPDLFEKLIIVDGLPFFAAAQNPYATEESVVQMLKPYLDTYKSQDEAAFVAQQKSTLRSMIQSEKEVEIALEWSLASDQKMLAYSVFEMMSKDLREEIAKIKAKTLVLGCYDGPYDWAPQFTREVAQKTYEDQYRNHSNYTLKVADKTRHFIMFDHPEWYFTQLDAFLNANDN